MHLYEICLIRPDLRHAESIIQSANCFEYLNDIITEVFDRIDDRINRNASKIADLKQRTTVVQRKVDSLVGRNKALKIFSPVKYPTSSEFRDTPVTLSTVNRRHIPNEVPYTIASNVDDGGQRNASDKLQFYHVSRKSNKTKPTESMIRLAIKSVGPFPYYTESIANLLLFADMKNMYDSKSHAISGHQRSARDESDRIGPSDVGSRIDALHLPPLNRNLNSKKHVDNFFYTPIITNAPALDVPHLLPDLPGVADDIAFNISNIDDLLVVPSENYDVPTIPPPPTDVALSASPVIPKPQPTGPSSSAVSNVPSAPALASTISQVPAQKLVSAPAPAPPPPPPPPPLPPAISSPATSPASSLPNVVKSEPIPKPKFEDENPHISLMASIRQAGGLGKAKLRATAIQPDKPKKISESSSPSGDLMADLHRKLAMRRKGISGTKEAEDAKAKGLTTSTTDSGGLLSSISSMIPPPPANITGDSTNPSEDETDWE